MPLSADEAKNVEDYQAAPMFHPMTCPICLEDLVVEDGGLRCPRCRYRQDWAPDFIRDGRWRAWTATLERLGPPHYLTRR